MESRARNRILGASRLNKALIEHYSGVLRATADFLHDLGNPVLAEKFAAEADQLSRVSTRRELKEMQSAIRLHLKGSSGAFTDVMSLNTSGTLTTEGIAHHKYLVNELRKFTRRIY